MRIAPCQAWPLAAALALALLASPATATAQSTVVFDDKDEGWAISNVSGGASDPRSTGILLRFQDGRWRHQNWRWSPLRQRGLGLSGELR